MKRGTGLTTRTECSDIPVSYFHRALALEYVSMQNVTALYLDQGEMLYVNGRPQEILNQWCLASGSSLNGRIDSLKALTSIRSKYPVMINETTMRMFFPMRSMNYEQDNTWLCDDMILDLSPRERESTAILFTSGFSLEIPYDIRMIRRQQENCRLYRQKLLDSRMHASLEPADLTDRLN